MTGLFDFQWDGASDVLLILIVTPIVLLVVRRVQYQIPRYRRLYWCSRRNHPMADWSPIVITDRAPDRYIIDSISETEEGLGACGRIEEDKEIVTYAYRCARHDREARG